MIDESKKREIVEAIWKEKKLLGSMNNVAKKLAISAATISRNILKEENWHDVSEKMWTEIATALGVGLSGREWVIVSTSNYRIMHSTLSDAQREGLFIGVSEKAGSGKTAAIAEYVRKDATHGVFAMQCEEWGRRTFLLALCAKLGVTAGRYDGPDVLTDGIVKFFKLHAKGRTPLVILDEADKLKPAALRFLIVLYNRLEDEIGLVACGTENLEKEIKQGVRKAAKGYDEIDSRLGRSFVHLMGSTKADVALICRANGIDDDQAISRIFDDSSPTRKMIGKKFVEVVEDLRTVKRKIKGELLRMRKAA